MQEAAKSSSITQRSAYLSGALFLALVFKMRIRVSDDQDSAVPKIILNKLQILVVCHKQARAGMTQIVETNSFQAILPKNHLGMLSKIRDLIYTPFLPKFFKYKQKQKAEEHLPLGT